MTIVLAPVAACDPKETGTDDNGSSDLDCSPDWLRPCEVEACEACATLGGEMFLILESYPPQYQCADQEGRSLDGFNGYDYCELPYCGETTTVLDATTTETPAGVTAADILAPAEGVHTLPLTWLPGEWAEYIDLEPQGTTTVDMTVLHENGELRYVEREEVVPETDGVPDIGPGVVDCHATVEADVEFSLVTVDGGLDESMSVTLTQVVDGDSPSPSTIDNVILWSDLMGTLTVVGTAGGYTVDDELSLHASFESTAVGGQLETGLERRTDKTVGYAQVTVATW